MPLQNAWNCFISPLSCFSQFSIEIEVSLIQWLHQVNLWHFFAKWELWKKAERQISDSSLLDIRDQFFPLLTWKWRENTSDVKSVSRWFERGDRSGTWKWLYRLLRTPWPFLLDPSYFFCACQYDHVYYCQISNLALLTDGLIPHGWAMSTYKRLH